MTFITASTPPPTEAAELIEKAIKTIISGMGEKSHLPKEVCVILEKVALADALSRWEELVDPEIYPTR